MDSSSLSDLEIRDAVSAAASIAREAGDYLLTRFGVARVAYRKASLDDVLDADVESERLILTRLQADFPEFCILSEEAGLVGAERSIRWIVDPLDGSVNFQRGLPVFAVSIALAAGKSILAGVTYLPMLDELYTAIRGKGAGLNGETIAVSQTAVLEEAVIHIGELERTGPDTVSTEQLAELTRVAHLARRIRLVGSSSADLAAVASGRADALIMHGGEPWDVAAGNLLVREAGGAITTLRYENGMTLTTYSNKLLHTRLTDLLRIG
ncbi:MAG TPA: inositol monophosphatase family protein [Ktedonobacterales bacterium]|nr:inositol monophosphatase family protein [Ktedonobacterales bacterium]